MKFILSIRPQYFKKLRGNARLLIICVFLISNSGYSQIGGKKSFEFLNVSVAARASGLGGINVSLADRDVNFFYANPALNSDTLSGFASANYQFYVADIGMAAITYANKYKKIGMISLGVQHMNYGSIKGYDPSGIESGNFQAQETALYAGKSHQIGNYRIGVNLKGIFSSIAGYRANAFAVDFGGLFVHPDKQLTVGIVIKNMGFVVSDFSETEKSRLPFDVQLGTTFKPQHMPLRFSISAYNLILADITYNDKTTESQNNTLQRIVSHLNFGTEILIHKNFNVIAGYNYLNHKALKFENSGGGAGLSIGFSIAVKSVDFVFSRAGYAAGSGAYSFTLSSNINKLLKRH